MSAAVYDILADLWEYPGEQFAARIEAARGALNDGRLDTLAEFATSRPLDEAEELFTRTFDINPVCTLECGWHLYGEDYARGAFLVRMRGLMRDLGIEESTELPDHLTHVLPVLGRLPAEEANTMARDCIVPALAKMLDGFQDNENPYRPALVALQDFLCERHGVEDAAATAGGGE